MIVIQYNAENRPVRWQSGDTVITMAFDRLGRRVDYCETRAGQVATHFRFVYDNFFCIQRLNVANGNAVRTEFVWDPSEPIATRPLIFLPDSGVLSYYFHDGNKNVSDLVDAHGCVVHYDYTAPFLRIQLVFHRSFTTSPLGLFITITVITILKMESGTHVIY